jgi:hypothetical protein
MSSLLYDNLYLHYKDKLFLLINYFFHFIVSQITFELYLLKIIFVNRIKIKI